jgi:hypothetical protein
VAEVSKDSNAAATALMAKMKMAPADRPKVMKECRRLLATLKLIPDKSDLILSFVETYLQLSATEFKQYEREVARSTPEEQEEMMPLISSITRKGMHDGQEQMLLLQIDRKFGGADPDLIARIDELPTEQLEQLGVALFDLATVEELEAWLNGS